MRYREFSEDALRKAQDIKDEDMRAGYLSMAAGWHTLATEIEKLKERAVVPEEFPRQADPDPAGSLA
jgi:hypothetical protein